MRTDCTPLCLFALLLLLAGCGDCGDSGTSVADAPEAHEGGDPIPEGAATIDFPWMGKQSVMCVGDAFERQVAYVDFSAEGGGVEIGSVTLAADGSGTGRFVVPVATLRTGHEDRDAKLQGGLWMDSDNHPEIVLEGRRLKRVRPTVWHVEGSWAMKGVSMPVSFYANVRYLPEMRNVGKDVARLEASFDIALGDYGVGGQYVGTPAVASTWTVQLVLLGTMKRSE